jgi:hypothetical protein
VTNEIYEKSFFPSFCLYFSAKPKCQSHQKKITAEKWRQKNEIVFIKLAEQLPWRAEANETAVQQLLDRDTGCRFPVCIADYYPRRGRKGALPK